MFLTNFFSRKHRPKQTKSSEARGLQVKFIMQSPNSWLNQHLSEPHLKTHRSPFTERIESLAIDTQALWPQPLWQGYTEVENYPWPVEKGSTHTSEQVRTATMIGNFFTWLVVKRQPKVVLEFGTAFGVSGMFWLAGLESNDQGLLLTFEPNEIWAKIAENNLSMISKRYQLTKGTFEDNVDLVLQSSAIDLAFIDAIHTSDFVFKQFELVANCCSPGCLILLDDIDFSPDMREC